MKKIFLIFISLFFICENVFAEQYLLQCDMDIEAVNTATKKVMKTYKIKRYFITDTILAEVYDANNLPLDTEKFDDKEIIFKCSSTSFNTIVETVVKYDVETHEITLNEIYANNNNYYTSRAEFVTQGKGSCTVTEIERKAVF